MSLMGIDDSSLQVDLWP